VPTQAEWTMALRHTTEEAVADYIYAQLNADPIYYFRHVDVRVDEGVATLSGYVWEANAIYRARKIASDVTGVTRVVSNDLRLERNGRNTGPAR
jgi:osmotically-inducible protein OsmY